MTIQEKNKLGSKLNAQEPLKDKSSLPRGFFMPYSKKGVFKVRPKLKQRQIKNPKYRLGSNDLKRSNVLTAMEAMLTCNLRPIADYAGKTAR